MTAAAALIGLVLAFGAVAATVVTGNPLYDALGTLMIGAVLMVIAVAIMIEVKGLIVGESAAPASGRARSRPMKQRPSRRVGDSADGQRRLPTGLRSPAARVPTISPAW